MAVGLSVAFLMLGLANLLSAAAFALALVLVIAQNLWMVAVAVTLATRGTSKSSARSRHPNQLPDPAS
jgi:hypothetical protein